MSININLTFGKVTQRGEDVKMDEFSELMKDERDIENQIKKLHREIDALESQRVMIARRSSKIFNDIINPRQAVIETAPPEL